jgi:hypothetical protein
VLSINAVFLGARNAFGVRAGDEYAAVLDQDGPTVVEVVDGGVDQDCEAGVKGRSRVIEDGVVIREVGEAKSREILQRTIED